jgi:precorrin-6Y C5,15-methyltransferase (decarboxylating)
MAHPVTIIGLSASGTAALRPALRALIEQADFVAGGARHLEHFPGVRGERFRIANNLQELVKELLHRRETGRCVVLATGDPMFFGVGKFLSEQLGSGAVQVEPAVSSMQLAFARAGLSWQEAALASVHGRELRSTLLPLLGQGLIGLFTDPDNNPSAVARFFLDHELDDYKAFVAEDLETPAERLRGWLQLADLLKEKTFASLSYLILRRTCEASCLADLQRCRDLVPGVPDDEFCRPADKPAIMTCQEVRAVVLAKLGRSFNAGDVVWDIGAGLGTVAVELAVLRPHIEVVAVEKDPRRAALARHNRQRFGAYNVRVVEGLAPDVLSRESSRPRAIFVGGSGGQLAAILALAAQRLQTDCLFVGAFVVLEHLGLTLRFFQDLGWPTNVTSVQVARSDALGELTGLRPFRAVYLVRAVAP